MKKNIQKVSTLFRLGFSSFFFIHLCHSLFAIFIVVICEQPLPVIFHVVLFFFLLKHPQKFLLAQGFNKIGTHSIRSKQKKSSLISNDGSSNWDDKFRFSCLSQKNSQFFVEWNDIDRNVLMMFSRKTCRKVLQVFSEGNFHLNPQIHIKKIIKLTHETQLENCREIWTLNAFLKKCEKIVRYLRKIYSLVGLDFSSFPMFKILDQISVFHFLFIEI